jgi:hypothetical protein
MIDNFSLIEPLLVFPHKDIFYFVQILQRKKDHKGVTLGGSNNNSRLIRAYFIKSVDHLNKVKEEMITLANVFNARISINLNPRNFEKAGFQVMQKIANQMMNKDYENIHRAYTSVCGEYHSETDRRWIIDLDKDDLIYKEEIKEFIEKEHLKLKDHDKVSRYRILAEIPSKSGLHIITNPFNLTTWDFNVEIHKNNPTNLYIP